MPTPEWEPRSPEDLLERVKGRGAQLRFRRRSRVLSGCIAVLVATALVAAGARGDGVRSTSLAASDPGGETTTTSAEEPSTTTTTSKDRDDGEQAGSTTTTGRGGGTPDVTTPTTELPLVGGGSTSTTEPGPARGPFDPPRLGSYRYRVELDGSQREQRLTYAELSRREGETRLSERWDDPGAQPRGQGLGRQAELQWRDSGVIVPNLDSCEERGQTTRYVFPLSVGATWSSDTTCSNERVGRIHSRSTARVTELTTIRAAGRSVETWVISISGTTDITLAGVKQTYDVEVTEWFSAAHGLRVKWVSQSRESASGTPRQSTSEILHLDPE